MELTAAQQKYFAYWLTRSLPSDSLGKLTASLQDAQVDLTPHQIDAALFAFKSPLSKGAILADEVGLGKTIEAGIILSQFWAEHRRHLLIIAPANLRSGRLNFKRSSSCRRVFLKQRLSTDTSRTAISIRSTAMKSSFAHTSLQRRKPHTSNRPTGIWSL